MHARTTCPGSGQRAGELEDTPCVGGLLEEDLGEAGGLGAIPVLCGDYGLGPRLDETQGGVSPVLCGDYPETIVIDRGRVESAPYARGLPAPTLPGSLRRGVSPVRARTTLHHLWVCCSEALIYCSSGPVGRCCCPGQVLMAGELTRGGAKGSREDVSGGVSSLVTFGLGIL